MFELIGAVAWIVGVVVVAKMVGEVVRWRTRTRAHETLERRIRERIGGE